MMCFVRVQEMNEVEDTKLRKVAGDMVKSASSDPKLSSTEFMQYVAGLAKGGKADEWSEEFLQKTQVNSDFRILCDKYLASSRLPFFLEQGLSLHITNSVWRKTC